MAALQTLRNKPALLMSVIGGALLLFIITLTDLRSCSDPSVMAEINGKNLTYPEYQEILQNEENLMAVFSGQKMSEEQKNQLGIVVWSNLVRDAVLAKEADKLGLIVTEDEVKEAISSVTPQQLQQVAMQVQYGMTRVENISYVDKLMFIVSRYMGQPSAQAYKQFMAEVDKQINELARQQNPAAEELANAKAACLYCESRIPAEILNNKYQALAEAGVISNPVSAEMTYNEYTRTCQMDLVSIPYTSVDDKDIKVTDEDIKAKYEAYKDLFKLNSSSRNLCMLDIVVEPTPSDEQAIRDEVLSLEDTLRKATTEREVTDIMRASKSSINYAGAYITKEAYTEAQMSDVASALDSMAVGSVSRTVLSPADQEGVRYFTTMKLVDKVVSPDSIQYCQFAVDSLPLVEQIISAVKSGSSLSAEAKKYNNMVQKYQLKGDTAWAATPYYVKATREEGDTLSDKYTDLCQVPAGETTYFTINQGGKTIYLLATVLSTKGSSAKYNVAVVKYPLKFSQKSYNDKRAALNKFLAKNKTLEELKKNTAKAGYRLDEYPNFSVDDASRYLAAYGGQGGKDAFKWAFDEAEDGEVSKVYEYGYNSDRLLVIGVETVNEGSYMPWDNAVVKAELTEMVKKDKKAEKILAEANKIKDFTAASKMKNAEVMAGQNMPLVQLAQGEPALVGAIEALNKAGFVGAVKGNNAVYFAQVKGFEGNGMQFVPGFAMDQQSSLNKGAILFGGSYQSNRNIRNVFDYGSSLLRTLQDEMKIVDHRYRF